MREPLLDPRMMGSFHSIFIVNTKALHLFHSRMVTAFCTSHHSPIIVVYALCRDVLLESLQIFALSPEMIKKNDENQMTWKGTMDLYPFQFSCMYLRYHELCEAFCEVGSFSYQNSDTKSAYFVWVFMLLIIHTKMETSILLQNLFNLSVKGNAIIAKCAMRDSKK